jgi:hypothetical protein
MMMVTVMMVVMLRILNNEVRCLSFGSSLPHFFMKLPAKPKCACRKMCTTTSLLQLFGFFSKSFLYHCTADSSLYYLFPIFRPAASCRFSLAVCTILTLYTGSARWQRA